MGKAEMRERIGKLLYADVTDPTTQADARHVCNSIGVFNGKVLQLGKRATAHN
jgi:hypothetical protein